MPDLVLVTTLRGHKRGVWAVQFSPVDQAVATASGLLCTYSPVSYIAAMGSVHMACHAQPARCDGHVVSPFKLQISCEYLPYPDLRVVCHVPNEVKQYVLAGLIVVCSFRVMLSRVRHRLLCGLHILAG